MNNFKNFEKLIIFKNFNSLGDTWLQKELDYPNSYPVYKDEEVTRIPIAQRKLVANNLYITFTYNSLHLMKF